MLMLAILLALVSRPAMESGSKGRSFNYVVAVPAFMFAAGLQCLCWDKGGQVAWITVHTSAVAVGWSLVKEDPIEEVRTAWVTTLIATHLLLAGSTALHLRPPGGPIPVTNAEP